MSFWVLYRESPRDSEIGLTLKITWIQFLIFVAFAGFPLRVNANDTMYYPADTWRTATFTEVGIDESLVLEGITEFIDQYEQVNSILIVKDGYLVLENYYNDTDADTINNVFSVTKSLTSTLIGMAIDDGIIPDLHVTLGEALPQYFADGALADKAEITLRDMLMMRSGIGWVEIFQAGDHIRGNDDEVLSVLENPMVARPSVFWNYSTGTSHLISAVFQAYADMPLEDYAHMHDCLNRLASTIGNGARTSQGQILAGQNFIQRL